jgi:hypothetical protein
MDKGGDVGKGSAQRPEGGEKGKSAQGSETDRKGAADKSDSRQDRKGSAEQQSDRAKDRTAEPKDRAGDKGKTAEPKDKAGDKARTAEPKDRAGDKGKTAEPKDRAGDKGRTAEPKDKAGDRKQDAARGRDETGKQRDQARQGKDDQRDQAQGKDRQRDDRAQGRDGQRDGDRVNLSQNQRTEVRQKLSSHREARVNNVNFSINVGTRVPRDFRLHALPTDIVSIVPAYRGYRYFIVEERVVIVHPTRYEIVEVIESDGGPRRGGTTSASLDLSRDQITLILDRIPADRGRADVNVDLALGAEVPSSVELYEFPEDIVTEVPAVRSYRYVVVDRKVLVVDPSGRDVVRVIER